MGALYEDVEQFFGGIFAKIGKFIAKYPIVFIVVSVLVSSLLGLGLLNIQYETSVERLYTPMRSTAFQNQTTLETRFPDNTRSEFYDHQLIWLGTYGDVIVTAKDGGNVLRTEIVGEVEKIDNEIRTITIDDQKRGHDFEELCARRMKKCMVSGKLLLEEFKKKGCLELNVTQTFKGETLFDDNLGQYLGSTSVVNNCTTAKAMRLRYNLKHDTKHQRQLSVLWERKLLEYLEDKSFEHVEAYYCVSESLDIEIADHLGVDIKFFALTIVIMVIYSSIVTSGGDWVSTRILLGWAGILAALLGILASFGLLCLCGLKFVDICGVMPFLILGLGVDDMFILMAGFRETSVKSSVEERISETYRSSAISVTITSLTNMLAFCIGATSPFLSIKNFCIFAGVAVFICYFNQLTFFGGCLVLHARRVESTRHCVTCFKTRSRRELEDDGSARCHVIFCCGETPKQSKLDESICERIPTKYLPKFLMQIPTKVFILGLFIVYLTISAIGTSKIQTGLKLHTIVPESSYLAKFLQKEEEHFSSAGPFVMFVANEYVDYRDKEKLKELETVFLLAQKSGYIDSDYISWLHHFIQFKDHLNLSKEMEKYEEEVVYSKLHHFLDIYPQYKNDILWNQDKTNIEASRFYVRSKRFSNSTQEGNMMQSMRFIAYNSTLPLTAFSPEFIYYEHYLSIMKNTLLAVGIAVIGMLFIALAFIPHPISITCVLLTMITIVMGMFGFMYFWGLRLSAITSVQIILSVGFCVDFTVHISHAFMAACGKNRNLRVVHALEKVGVPVLNGAVSSILGILMLAFAKSYVFKSFFKTMLLIILLGLGHALLVLPVILSFLGPRRTGKPRVFIPISSEFRIGVQSPSPNRGTTQCEGSANENTTDETTISSECKPIDATKRGSRTINAGESMELIRMESPPDERIDLLTPIKSEKAQGFLLKDDNARDIREKDDWISDIQIEPESNFEVHATSNEMASNTPKKTSLNGGSPVAQQHDVFPQQLEPRDLLVHIQDNDTPENNSDQEDHRNPFLTEQNDEQQIAGNRESCHLQ